MRITREYLRTPRKGLFRTLWKRNGSRAGWTYWADNNGFYGVGRNARAAAHDARKSTKGFFLRG